MVMSENFMTPFPPTPQKKYTCADPWLLMLPLNPRIVSKGSLSAMKQEEWSSKTETLNMDLNIDLKHGLT